MPQVLAQIQDAEFCREDAKHRIAYFIVGFVR